MGERSRAGLDRDTVVRTALDLLDEVGLDALSTRRLAERLGVKSPALYWHFRDKGELLDLMAQELLRPAGPGDGSADWATALADGARDRRRRLLSRRDGARLVAGTRPGRDAARQAEDGIAELVALGLDPASALHTLIAVAHFVTGFVLEEQAAARRHITDAAAPGDDLPLLRAALQAGGVPEDDRSFEHGLTALVDGLARRLPGPTKGESP